MLLMPSSGHTCLSSDLPFTLSSRDCLRVLNEVSFFCWKFPNTLTFSVLHLCPRDCWLLEGRDLICLVHSSVTTPMSDIKVLAEWVNLIYFQIKLPDIVEESWIFMSYKWVYSWYNASGEKLPMCAYAVSQQLPVWDTKEELSKIYMQGCVSHS